MDLVVCSLTIFTHWSKWVTIKQYDVDISRNIKQRVISFLHAEID